MGRKTKIAGVVAMLVVAWSLAQSRALHAADYICENDPAYVAYAEGSSDTVAGAVMYSDPLVCQNNCVERFRCDEINTSASFGYTCSMLGSMDIGGDLGPNLFSAESDCEMRCILQNSCLLWQDDGCKIVGTEYSDPVTDYTGKTVFTKKVYVWQCDSETTEQIGCNRYETNVTEGDFSYSVGAIGYETKDFSEQFEETLGLTNMMEQMEHIWSGWYGYCEKGYRFDDSWLSDPMTLLNFAMMLYSGALKGAYGGAMESAAKAINDTFKSAAAAFDSAKTSVESLFDSSGAYAPASAADASNALGQCTDPTISGLSITSDTGTIDALAGGTTTAAAAMPAEIDVLHQFNTITEIGGVDVLWSDVATLAAAAFAEPQDEDYRTADEYMKAMMGDPNAGTSALAYRSCMASLGLSFPNLVSYSASVESGTSEAMKRPYDNPVRLTREQLAALVHATTEEYVRSFYKIVDHVDDYYTIVAGTSAAYTQIGQVLCSGGETARATNVISQKSAEESSGINGGAMASAAVGMAIGKLPPPYNLVGSILFKTITSIQKGNACRDEELAMQWGLIQYKTNKFLNFGQCHYFDTDCASKFLGSCIRKKREYCCYDQVITRIFVEGLKVQLGQDWSDCNGITINDLKNISFRECLAGEDPVLDHCFPADKYQELKSSLMMQLGKNVDTDALAQQAANSMAIP